MRDFAPDLCNFPVVDTSLTIAATIAAWPVVALMPKRPIGMPRKHPRLKLQENISPNKSSDK